MGSIPTLGTLLCKRADSSAVERLAYTEEVTGSNPVSPILAIRFEKIEN